MKNRLLTLLFLFICTMTFAQNQGDFKKKFYAAVELMYNQNYSEAIKVLKQLDSISPNANLKFQIGLCYLNSPIGFEKSIDYLLESTKNISPEYKFGNHKETKAPIDAIMILGDAYHKAYRFDEAMDSYEKFAVSFKEMNQQLKDEVLYKINVCKNAKELVSKPVNMTIESVGLNINSPYAEYKPLITADESRMFFTSRREGSTGNLKDEKGKFFEDIYYSENINGEWGEPQKIGFPINTPDHEATAGLSADGQQLFIYMFKDGSGDIYSSNLLGETWSAPQKLNENINTKFWEPHASISPDGEYLFFTSDRDGGMGGRDIYMSKKLPNGDWGLAQNLGPNINTAHDEDGPFLHPDGKTLYFSSQGHNSMGGFDIMYVEWQEDGTWSKPQNMGYPINTTGDDVFFNPTSDGKRGYYSSFRADGQGDQDIYMLTFPEVKEKSLAIYKGVIKMRDGAIPENVSIFVKDAQTGELIGEYKPNAATGKYLIVLPPGRNYEISYDGSACFFKKDYIDVPEDAMYSVIDKSIDLNPLEAGEVVNLDHIYFDYDKATLKDESKVQLDEVVELLLKCTSLIIEIGGHTDSKGDDNYNLNLSEKRAQAVVEYITSNGIEVNRLKAVGYGETKPVAPNDNEDGTPNEENRALNRRTEMKILSI
jgi:outer membrane protein OmpA-like peptidoglycan-associated protein/tetratricopeptide (TPR) repeat protein